MTEGEQMQMSKAILTEIGWQFMDIPKDEKMPNLFTDFDAIRFVEACLQEDEDWPTYINHLKDITKARGRTIPYATERLLIHASAEAKAEALAKTFCVWKSTLALFNNPSEQPS